MFIKASLACGLLLAALPAAAQSIAQHFGTGADSCYQRAYSASHLAEHPGQRVEAIQLSHFNEDSTGMAAGEMLLRIAVRLRGQAPWQTLAFCVNRNGKLACGIECDGGRFDVVSKNQSAILITGGTDIYFTDCDAG
jgi:hypothetical protein